MSERTMDFYSRSASSSLNGYSRPRAEGFEGLLQIPIDRSDATTTEQTGLSRWYFAGEESALQKYLELSPVASYKHLVAKFLGYLKTVPGLERWITDSQENKKTLVATAGDLLQDLLVHDRYLKERMVSIAFQTRDRERRNALMLTSVERYCGQPVAGGYRAIALLRDYLIRRGQRLTPRQKELLQLLSRRARSR